MDLVTCADINRLSVGQANAAGDRAAAELQMPASSVLLQKVAKHGREVLKHRLWLSPLPKPYIGPIGEDLECIRLFQANPFLCAAHIQPLGILEVGTVSARPR